jgi:DNA invertase Pin-like site-specific DNA recombinase
MITMLGAIAEFERGLLLERQREGVAKAKAEGKYKGRKPTAWAKAAEVIKLESDICIRFGILTDTCPCESGGCAKPPRSTSAKATAWC